MVSSVCLCHSLPQHLIFNIALAMYGINCKSFCDTDCPPPPQPPPPAPDRSSNNLIRISHQEMRDATEENLQS